MAVNIGYCRDSIFFWLTDERQAISTISFGSTLMSIHGAGKLCVLQIEAKVLDVRCSKTEGKVVKLASLLYSFKKLQLYNDRFMGKYSP